MEREHDHKPFAEISEPKNEGTFFTLREVKNNPKFVVKELQEYLTGTYAEEDDKEIADNIQQFMNSIRDEQLGEYVPKSQVVIGENSNNEKTIYIVSEKINGLSLEKSEISDVKKEELTEIVKAFVDHFIKSFNNGKGKTLELNAIYNYINGTNENRPDGERLYFVDTFPVYSETVDEFILRLRILFEVSAIDMDTLNDSIKKLQGLETVVK